MKKVFRHFLVVAGRVRPERMPMQVIHRMHGTRDTAVLPTKSGDDTQYAPTRGSARRSSDTGTIVYTTDYRRIMTADSIASTHLPTPGLLPIAHGKWQCGV